MNTDLKPGDIVQTKLGKALIKARLGKGKSGISFRVEIGGAAHVLKAMHDEPNPFFSFDDEMSKTALELVAYNRLVDCGIRVPTLHEANIEREYLVKEYIAGEDAADLIAQDAVPDTVFDQLFAMAATARACGFNLDTFPLNFIVTSAGKLVYIDYETSPYTEEWNLVNWGLWYWVNPAGMQRFLETGKARHINADLEGGRPHKAGFEDAVARLVAQFGDE